MVSQYFALHIQDWSNQRKSQSVHFIFFGVNTKRWMASSDPQGAELSRAGQVTLDHLPRKALPQRWRCLVPEILEGRGKERGAGVLPGEGGTCTGHKDG